MSRPSSRKAYAKKSSFCRQRGVSRNPRGEATAKFVNAESKIEERVIAVDRSIGNSWLVSGGVADGDRLVVEGSQRARAGQDVEVSAVRIDDRTGAVVAITEGADKPAAQANSNSPSPGISLATAR